MAHPLKYRSLMLEKDEDGSYADSLMDNVLESRRFPGLGGKNEIMGPDDVFGMAHYQKSGDHTLQTLDVQGVRLLRTVEVGGVDMYLINTQDIEFVITSRVRVVCVLLQILSCIRQLER